MEHLDFLNTITGETVKRITHCRNCKFNVIEFFGPMYIQRDKPFVVEQEKINQYQNLPRA